MSFEPLNNRPSDPQNDPYPDLPKLPQIPLEVVHERLQDEIGGIFSSVAGFEECAPNELAKRVSLSLGTDITEADIHLIFSGLTPITIEQVEHFCRALNDKTDRIYRWALLLKQLESVPKGELAEMLHWEVGRELEKM